MEIVEGYRPGAIGAIAGLHGTYYAREWGFGRFFESKVATELCAFLDRHDPATDRLWLVVDGQGATVGSMVIDGGGPDVAAKGAHLRWFILGDGCRGGGCLRAVAQLVHQALARPPAQRALPGRRRTGRRHEEEDRGVRGDGDGEDRRDRHVQEHDDVHRARVEQRARERAGVDRVLHALAVRDRLADAREVVEHPDDDRRHEDAEEHHRAAVVPQQRASKVIHTRTPLPGWA